MKSVAARQCHTDLRSVSERASEPAGNLPPQRCADAQTGKPVIPRREVVRVCVGDVGSGTPIPDHADLPHLGQWRRDAAGWIRWAFLPYGFPGVARGAVVFSAAIRGSCHCRSQTFLTALSAGRTQTLGTIKGRYRTAEMTAWAAVTLAPFLDSLELEYRHCVRLVRFSDTSELESGYFRSSFPTLLSELNRGQVAE